MKKLNRRDFLKCGSAIALLPAAAPSLLVGKKTEKAAPSEPQAPQGVSFLGNDLVYTDKLGERPMKIYINRQRYNQMSRDFKDLAEGGFPNRVVVTDPLPMNYQL